MIEKSERTTRSKSISAFALILVLATVFISDAVRLYGSDLMLGVDGYYYALQVKTLFAEGTLYYETFTPIVIYYFSFLSFIFSDPVISIKIGVLILHLTLLLGIYRLVGLLTQNHWLGLLAISVAGFSGLHFFYISEFLSNLGALVFLVWGAIAVIRFLETQRRSRLIVAGILLAASMFSHRSMFLIIPILFFYLITSKFIFEYANKNLKLPVAVLAVASLSLPTIALSLLRSLMPSEMNAEILIYPWLPFRKLILPESFMVILSGILALISIRLRETKYSKISIVVFFGILLWSALTTLNPFLNHRTGVMGIVSRLDTLAFMQAALAAPLAIKLLAERRKVLRFAGIICIIGLLVWSYSKPLPIGMQNEYVTRRERLIKDLPNLGSDLCDRPLIIARHGDQFLVNYILGIPSQQKFPENLVNKCIYWLIDQRKAVTNYETETIDEQEFILIEDARLRPLMPYFSESEKHRLIRENPHLANIVKIR